MFAALYLYYLLRTHFLRKTKQKHAPQNIQKAAIGTLWIHDFSCPSNKKIFVRFLRGRAVYVCTSL